MTTITKKFECIRPKNTSFLPPKTNSQQALSYLIRFDAKFVEWFLCYKVKSERLFFAIFNGEGVENRGEATGKQDYAGFTSRMNEEWQVILWTNTWQLKGREKAKSLLMQISTTNHHPFQNKASNFIELIWL